MPLREFDSMEDEEVNAFRRNILTVCQVSDDNGARRLRCCTDKHGRGYHCTSNISQNYSGGGGLGGGGSN